MTILLIEYRTPDFGGWKEMFDRDPMDREGHGVTRHWLYQDADDPTHIMLSLEFPSTDKARVFLSAPCACSGCIRCRQTWVLGEVEAVSY